MLLAYAANINRVKTAHPLLYLYIQMITFTSFMYAWSLCLNDQDCQIPTSLYRYSITTLCIQNIDWLVFNANFSSISATLYIEIKSQVTEQCSKSWTNVSVWVSYRRQLSFSFKWFIFEIFQSFNQSNTKITKISYVFLYQDKGGIFVGGL